MYPDVNRVLHRLPGFRQFIFNIREDLHAGRSAVVVVPCGAPTEGLWSFLTGSRERHADFDLDLEVIEIARA